MSLFKFNLKHIEAFVEVAEQGTFRRAAQRLHTTQPNISTRIAQLEEHLGQRLLDRDAGSVRMTPKGLALIEPARDILRAVDGFVEAVGDQGRLEGKVRLGVTEMVVHTWLRQFVREMKSRFPDVDIDLTVDLSASLSESLFAGDLDLTFQNGPFDRTTPCSEPLGTTSHLWVAVPALLPEGAPVEAESLLSHAILGAARPSPVYRQIGAHFRASARPARLVALSNMGSCLQMALDGLGVACLPAAIVEEPLEDGRLHEIDYGWRPDDLVFSARCLSRSPPIYIREAILVARKLFPPPESATAPAVPADEQRS